MDCSPAGSSVHGVSQARVLDCHALLQWIFPIQRSNPSLLRLLRWQAGSLPLAPQRLPEDVCLTAERTQPRSCPEPPPQLRDPARECSLRSRNTSRYSAMYTHRVLTDTTQVTAGTERIKCLKTRCPRINMYTLLYLKWISNVVLLCNTGNSAQGYVAELDGRGVWGRMDTCICTAESLCRGPEISQHC